jgi:hypothetical protein
MPKPRSLKTKLKKDEFYCLSCRARAKGDNLKYKKIRNYKRGMVPMMKANCHKCDGKLAKIIKAKDMK